MRRTYLRSKEKIEIMELMRTCRQACDELGQKWKTGEIGAVQKMLADMQTGVISIGSIIEKVFGETCETILKLEQYCEILYQVSLKLSDKNSREKTISLFKQETYNIYNQLSSIKAKTEIVFLPYKASMWDCMESIWEEAARDEECLVYVVPIPYFERDSSGALSKVCYEGKQLPENVQITPYREFNLKQERPDIIYIHNVYEDQNLVTSVHPDYFASQLKKYTDMLVYIPYYISGKGPMPEMHCNLPGYRFVDKIIVQDEEKKESLSEFVEADKILVLGNPKADRLLKLGARRREILEKEIPKEWRGKISGKRVFFYNTSLTGMLEYSEDAMDKIRYVISRFDGREDAVLLWRPHPLMESTLKAMRPDMYRQLKDIKKEFARKDNCILDETADGTTAAVISDAYIGENSSSMVHYFGVLGKPVFYIDWKKKQELTRDEREALLFYDFYVEGESIWFVPFNEGLAHCLCRMDLNSGKTELVRRLPGKPQNPEREDNYFNIIKHEKRIMLIPYRQGDIYIFDEENDSALKLILKSDVPIMWFNGTKRYKNKLYLIPECYPALVEIDLDSMKIKEYEECIKPFLKADCMEPMFLQGSSVIGKYLYIASAADNRMLIFDMECGEFTVKTVGDDDQGFISSVYDEKYYWLSVWKQNRIIRWEENGPIRGFYYPVEKDKDKDRVNGLLVDNGDDLLIFCGNQENILSMNKETGKCEIIKPCPGEKIEQGLKLGRPDAGYKIARRLDSERVIAYNWYDYSILLWNTKTGEQKRFPCRMPREVILKEEKERKVRFHVRNTPFAVSEKTCGLSCFMDYICLWPYELSEHEKQEYANIIKNFYEGSGKAIHHCIREYIS